MTQALTLSPKDPLERVPMTFRFDEVMADDDTLATAVVAVEAVVAGTDATPNAILDGGASMQAQTVAQWITGGVAGATYRLRCTVTTTQGRTLVLRALLPVRTLV